MTALSLPPETLAAIAELPPSSLLALATPDQAAHWQAVRLRYYGIYLELKGYFSGKKQTELEQFAPPVREFFRLQRQRWTAFYSLIYDAWGEIQAQYGDLLGANGINEPSQCLLFSIEAEAMWQMSPAFSGYRRWTPHKSRERIKAIRAYQRSELKPAKAKAVESDIKKLAAEQEAYRQLDWLILDLCDRIAKKSSSTRENLRLYKLADSALITHIERKLLHRRNKEKGDEWRSGQRFQMSSNGGKTA